MSRLVPEKRLDRNGHWVTRHVLAADAASPWIPAPRAPGAAMAATDRKVFSMVVTAVPALPTPALVQASGVASDIIFSFDATWAQMADVCAVTNQAIDAALLLTCGARTAEEARDLVVGFGVESVLGDGAGEAARLAMERGISPERFLKHFDEFSTVLATPSDAVEAVRFCGRVAGDYSYEQQEMARRIAAGRISYEDVEALPLWHLRKADHARLAYTVLTAIAAGEAKSTLDDLTECLDDIEDLEDDSAYFDRLAQILIHTDVSELPERTNTHYLCRAFGWYRHGDWTKGQFGDAEAAQRAAYFVSVRSRRESSQMAQIVNGFYEAGVPAELAAEVMEAGGTPAQAVAIRDEAAPRGLSSGAL